MAYPPGPKRCGRSMLPGYLPSSYWSAPVAPFGCSRNALFDAHETSGTSAAASGPYRTDTPPSALSVMTQEEHTTRLQYLVERAEGYWDRLHYRAPVARKLEAEIAGALADEN